MKQAKFKTAFTFLWLVGIAALSSITAAAQDGALSVADTDRIVSRFTAKEAEFRRALNSYSFKRDALVQSIGMGGQVVGEYHRVSVFTFDDQGNRYEKISFFPMSSMSPAKRSIRLKSKPRCWRSRVCAKPSFLASHPRFAMRRSQHVSLRNPRRRKPISWRFAVDA